MGFDCTAVTVIGLRTTRDRLVEKVEATTFIDHSRCPTWNASFKYCPDCSQAGSITTTETRFKELVDGWDIPTRVAGYKVYHVDEEDNIYICISINTREGPRSYDPEAVVKEDLSLEELIKEREIMKKKLEPLTIWNDEDFGIFTLIEFSD